MNKLAWNIVSGLSISAHPVKYVLLGHVNVCLCKWHLTEHPSVYTSIHLVYCVFLVISRNFQWGAARVKYHNYS